MLLNVILIFNNFQSHLNKFFKYELNNGSMNCLINMYLNKKLFDSEYLIKFISF